MCKFLNYYGVSFEPGELAARYQESAAAQLMERPIPYAEIDVWLLVFEEILADGLEKTPERTLVVWLARLFRSLTCRRLGLFPDTQPALKELGSAMEVPPGGCGWSDCPVRVFSEP